jgi:hypothetical protein
MSNAAEFVNEQEAAKLARVSASTLARFAEAGYFQIEINGQERFYPKRALSSVFGITFPEASKENVIPFPIQAASSPTSDQTLESSSPVTDAQYIEATSNSIVPEMAEPPLTAAAVDPIWGTPIDNQSKNIEALETQANHFRQIIQMHADILSRQEREIENLKGEREWLRRRIEKLEEKAERDQVLLLSEAQTVKQLIQIQSQRKSTMRLALEWLGIAPSETAQVNSLDYQTKPLQEAARGAAPEYAAKDTSASSPQN